MTAETDPFAEFRLKPKTQPIPQEIPTEQKEDPFAEFRIRKREDENIYETALRNIARTGSRAVETLVGLPGDIQDLINSGVFYGLEKLTGLPRTEEAEHAAREASLPTSKKLKGKAEELSKGYLKPQGKVEETLDEATETVTSLLGPMKFRKALGVGLGASAIKEGIGALGFGKGTQEAGKLGSMFILSAINPGGAAKYANSLYDKADKLLPAGAKVDAKTLKSELASLHNDLSKGVTTPPKNALLKPIEELFDKIKGNEIPVEELVAAKRDINTLIRDPALLKREKKLFNKIAKDVNDAINKYGPQNPEFLKTYQSANQAFGGIAQSQKAADYIRKKLPIKPEHSAYLTIFGEAALGHPELIIPTIGATALGMGALKTQQLLQRVMTNPTLRRYYANVVREALNENSVAAARNFEKLANELDKDQSSEKKPR